MKYRIVEAQLHTIFTSALDRGDWPFNAPAAVTLNKSVVAEISSLLRSANQPLQQPPSS